MKKIFLAISFLLTAALAGQEKITLTTPETHPSNTEYSIKRLQIDYALNEIYIDLRGLNGEIISCLYTTPASTTSNPIVPSGVTLINGLNKANLSSVYAGNASTGSLAQRINYRLVVMGESTAVCSKPITGTLSGTVP